MRKTMNSLSMPEPPPHISDLPHLDIATEFERMTLGTSFVGKSSEAVLVKAAIDLKADVKRAHRPSSKYLLDDDRGGDHDAEPWNAPRRRMKYWARKPWWSNRTACGTYGLLKFPSEALLGELIELYFTHQNIYLPLLHRPTFERSVAQGLHLKDDGFAATLLLVCAIGSRWSMNPSVTHTNLACGREWFDQVPPMGSRFWGQATLYDLQYYCLAVMFLDGSANPQACWTLVGIGLRLAQDIGVHCRKAHVEPPSVESELYKRAFWILVYLDRVISAGIGRTCALQYDDFDIDPALEVDDEYWEHPTRPFQQPAGVPSRVTFFNTFMWLNHILGFCLKGLYSTNKMLALFAIKGPWEEYAIPELDSVLNNWDAQIPDHLHWDPTREDQVFFDQSVALHCAYYHVQILIHRSFILIPRDSASPPALPSLSICTNAARACANMVDVQRRRNGNIPTFRNLQAVFNSGLILLLNVWSAKRTGLMPDPGRDMANVHKCMEAIHLCGNRWEIAGMLWHILAKLTSASRLSVPVALNTEECSNAHNPHSGDTRSSADPSSILFPQPFDHSMADAQFQTFDPMMDLSEFDATLAPQMWIAPGDPLAQMYSDMGRVSHEFEGMANFPDAHAMEMVLNGLEADAWRT
ncbi:Zn(2)-C6 fungal-type domain-containing protein [Mycena venus]|uniref:Zn(2)-C6 fungal-type domain-containing protein n=1 Tax=Mycena venus TaxID=2733690 RepID=A0A8H7CV00_9AGAR|nr:Zn(2)-C6 fungal-type domain-containing protein [Mycena venus]